MSFALDCDCGAQFEVEEANAGQVVSCPECHRPLKAPPLGRRPIRTSGYALASLVLALVLAFSVVGTALAVLLGFIALVSIARHPDRVAGSMVAIAGIVLGLLFSSLTLFALSKGEIFDEARSWMRGEQVDRTGPLEIVRQPEGFSIKRASPHWGVAGPELAKTLDSSASLLLANPGKMAYLDVTVNYTRSTVFEYRAWMVKNFRTHLSGEKVRNRAGNAANYTIRETRSLDNLGKAAVEEVILDAHENLQTYRFVIRLIKDDGTNRIYLVQGWTSVRRFPQVEADFKKSMDSFRLLDQQEH